MKQADEFDYEEWYREQAERLAELLMEALDVACNINEADSLWDPIKQKIQELDLPPRPCKRCGKMLSYWDWAINKGYCVDCINELMKEELDDEV